jgi:hypothetical protein
MASPSVLGARAVLPPPPAGAAAFLRVVEPRKAGNLFRAKVLFVSLCERLAESAIEIVSEFTRELRMRGFIDFPDSRLPGTRHEAIEPTILQTLL